MTENEAITGDVIKVELCHDAEGWEHTDLTIRVAHRAIPYSPHDYVRGWRGLQEQQQPFSEYDIKEFERYEKKRDEYNSFTRLVNRLHLGPIELVQKVRSDDPGR
jgi:hypothetical protein